MKKLFITSDHNKKTLAIKSIIIKKLNKIFIKKHNISIVIGGDGFMLQTLKKK